MRDGFYCGVVLFDDLDLESEPVTDVPWDARRALFNFKSLTNGEACHVEAVKPPSDAINHPDHYNTGKIEVIEAIEDWQLDFHLGSAIKYIARAGRKNPDTYVEDLQKAIWFIGRRIELHGKRLK